MEIKFTPWRMHYIKNADTPGDAGCILCTLGQAPLHSASLVLYRGNHCYIVMNRYPYNTGHLMIVPYQHTADLPGLPAAIAGELFELTRRCAATLAEVLMPHGFNIGMNLGRTAGAGIDEHLHMHIVPRWNGDANFMPIIGGTKLIPEALEQTYDRLLAHFTVQ